MKKLRQKKLCQAVSTEYRNATDRQTDGQREKNCYINIALTSDKNLGD